MTGRPWRRRHGPVHLDPICIVVLAGDLTGRGHRGNSWISLEALFELADGGHITRRMLRARFG